jgi:hypothetical protein
LEGIMRRLLPLLALATLAVACKDSTSSGDPLTQLEAEQLAAVLVEEGFVGFEAPSAASGAGAAVIPITITINDVGPCDGGGTVALSGTLTADIDPVSESGTLSYNYTMTPNSCEVTTESQQVFWVSGDPNLSVTGTFGWAATGFDGTLTYDGGFSFVADDGREGACAFDIDAAYDVTLDPNTGEATAASASMSGSVCGFTIDRSISIG